MSTKFYAGQKDYIEKLNELDDAVASVTGSITLDKSDVGLDQVDNTSDANKPVSTAQQAALDLKANSATTYSKTETDSRIQAVVGAAPAALDTLVEIATQLQNDESAVAALTTTVSGKEPAITGGTTSQYWRGDKSWRDFFTDVRATTLTGLSTATNAVITGADTVLTSLGKLQRQVTDALATLAGKQDTLVSGTSIKTVNGTSLLGAGDVTVSGGASDSVLSNKTGAYTVVAGDKGNIINCTSGTFTVGLTAAATLGANFHCWIWNTGTGVITIDPNGAETIDGVSTLVLRQGEGLQIECTGTAWEIGGKKAMRGYVENFGNNITRPVASGTNTQAFGTGSASGVAATAFHACTASASPGFAAGLNSGYGGAQAVTGAGAMALGGSYASGVDSFAAAVGNNTSSYGATGANSVSIGALSKASGASAFALGDNAIASGTRSLAIAGQYNTASGTGSVALGGYTNTASANYSYAFGSNAVAALYGKQAFSSGMFTAAGDAQSGKMVLRKASSNDTPVVLTANAAAATSTNQVNLPDNSTYRFRVEAVAMQSAAQGSSVAAYTITGLIRRGTGAASTVLLSSAKTVDYESVSSLDFNVAADTTLGGLSVTATGLLATSIQWVATVETVEVTFA